MYEVVESTSAQRAMMIGNVNMQSEKAMLATDAPLYEWYDGAGQSPRFPRLSDPARTLVSACRAGAGPVQVVAMAKRLKFGDHTLSDEEWQLVGFTVLRFVAYFNGLGWGNCDVCGRPSTSKCARCRQLSYCSVAHQRTDWPAHKDFCRAHRSR